MSKLTQLEAFRRFGLPTPPFRALSYAAFRAGEIDTGTLRFPLAVRSTYLTEDGAERSMAGHFTTRLFVEEEGLPKAIDAVFASYPRPEKQAVILQEMVIPDYSGVLFAFCHGVWKVELGAGGPEAVVAGRQQPRTMLLPRFSSSDRWGSRWWRFWSGVPAELFRPLVDLSVYAGTLLRRLEAPAGLDIEFAIREGRLFLLQARPITTPAEAENVLTTANHKEILPPRPSVLMTAVISSSGMQLFRYYRQLDSSLPAYSFIEEAAGMPWINLSALLDVMVHWGLPTRLVTDSVGAEDPYRVDLRPWRILRKLPVFWGALGRQRRATRTVHRWLSGLPEREKKLQRQRKTCWAAQPVEAWQQWLRDFQQLYVELVTHMQDLTAAMSGSVQALDRLGVLAKMSGALSSKSASTNYLEAFRDLQHGRIDRQAFLQRFGHRGFYESDLAQPRFADYGEAEWQSLVGTSRESATAKYDRPEQTVETGIRGWIWLFRRTVRLVHTREQLRHEVMRHFYDYRKELERESSAFLPPGSGCWEYRPKDLEHMLRTGRTQPPPVVDQSGWDMDTFLCNRQGRRLPLGILDNVVPTRASRNGIGIYPGRVSGHVWRVSRAEPDNLQPPPFRPLILVADALDPGWIPYFTQVDGVISYTGGLLSHASIILRESRIPAITQLPGHRQLRTGDRIEMDGRTGTVKSLETG